MSGYPWSELGIAQTRDEAEIRRAYADKLRALDIDNEINAYASLRGARDEALWLARQDQSDEGDYGLGSLDDDFGVDVGLGGPDTSITFSADGADAPEPMDWTTGSGASEQVHGGGNEPQLTDAQIAAQSAWQGLTSILLPNNEPSDEAVTHEELEDGQAHLAVLLDRAEESDLDEHDAIDTSLGYLMAEAWPRSAPFVEPANQAFHWLDEAGQLEERPALMFLNARLKGMRFHEKVQNEDHPLHKAWAELSRPGKANMLDRLKVNRTDVYTLLSGIRERFPEVESYLDEDRVLSWDREPPAWGPRLVQYGFIVFLLFQLLRFCGTVTEDQQPTLDELTSPEAIEARAAYFDKQAKIYFGEGYDMVTIRIMDPEFAGAFSTAAFNEQAGGSQIQSLLHRRARVAGRIAEFDELVALTELKRIWLRTAKDVGVAQCMAVINDDFASSTLELSEEDRAREREIMAQLLEAKVLSHTVESGEYSYSVPGWMIGEVMTKSGLGEQAVRDALGDFQNTDRCAVQLAMLDIAAAQPGRVPEDLLRLL